MTAINTTARLLVTEREAAEMLAISPRSLWSLAASNQIPRCKVGRSVRYSIEDLREFVDQQRTHASRP